MYGFTVRFAMLISKAQTQLQFEGVLGGICHRGIEKAMER